MWQTRNGENELICPRSVNVIRVTTRWWLFQSEAVVAVVFGGCPTADDPAGLVRRFIWTIVLRGAGGEAHSRYQYRQGAPGACLSSAAVASFETQNGSCKHLSAKNLLQFRIKLLNNK
jgi:hypothetical protein